MKLIPVVTMAYLFASSMSSFLYPQLFVPMMVSYGCGVTGYEVTSYIERRFTK